MHILKKNSSVLALVVIIFIISITYIYYQINLNTHQNFSYILDDPYIHLSIAKNFAENGTYGINNGQFAAASSSPLWTLTIFLLIKIFGDNQFYPLILNFIISLFLIFVLFRYLKKFEVKPTYIFIFLIVIIYATPVPAMIFSGMEHLLHGLLLIILVFKFADFINNNGKSYDFILILTLLSIMTLVRFECLFLLPPFIIILIMKKKYSKAILILLFGLMSLIVYGVISLSNGGMFLPNSVLIKAGIQPGMGFFSIISDLLFKWFKNIIHNPIIQTLILISLVNLLLINFKEIPKKTYYQTILIIFLSVVFLHAEFAAFGWFFRYEAYLVLFCLLINFIIISEYTDLLRKLRKIQIILIGLIALIILSPFFDRALMSYYRIPRASKNIYEQQHQMANFIKKYYNDKNVGLNDIGVVSYFTNARITDFWGLGDNEIAKYKLSYKYSTDLIKKISEKRKLDLIIIYDEWFEPPIAPPSNWIKAGSWRIALNIVCGSSIVSFYAKDSVSYNQLIKNLKLFSTELPKTVFQQGE